MKFCVRSIVISILYVVLTACNSSKPLSALNISQVTEVSIIEATQPANLKTATSISPPIFLPSPTYVPLPTSTATPLVVWGDFAGPSEDSEMEIPSPVPTIDFPKKTVNVLLLGKDRHNLTDVVMILSLDPVAKKAVLISIPRDLYVYIPGWKVNRINTAEYKGGFEMVADTVLYNLGIPVHHWVRVEYTGFSEAINILGGIDVRTSGTVLDRCGGVTYAYASNVVYHMDGTTAMCYVSMRAKSSDFDRMRRQQDVLMALFDRFISIKGFMKIPQLYDTFSQFVKTDMGLDEILPLLPLAYKLAKDPSQIRLYRIDNSVVENWRTPETRAAVLLPKRELIESLLNEAFSQ